MSTRVLVLIVFTTSILLFIPLLLRAIVTEPLSVGLQEIKENPWALATFIDFCVGFAFNLSFICVREASDLYSIPERKPSYWRPLLLILLALLVGNPAVLSYGIIQIIYAPTIQDAFLIHVPSSYVSTDMQRRNRAKYFSFGFKILMACLLSYYVFICAVALYAQPISEGWQYIKSDPWALLAFVDNMLGILFTSVYIAVLENGKWKSFIVWWVLLLLLGNGITAIYALSRCWNSYTLGDSFLWKFDESSS
eukprot:jgi/Galph1/2590/GphlegSOOS_G1264.1